MSGRLNGPTDTARQRPDLVVQFLVRTYVLYSWPLRILIPIWNRRECTLFTHPFWRKSSGTDSCYYWSVVSSIMEYYIHGEDTLIRRQKFYTIRGRKILFDTKIDKFSMVTLTLSTWNFVCSFVTSIGIRKFISDSLPGIITPQSANLLKTKMCNKSRLFSPNCNKNTRGIDWTVMINGWPLERLYMPTTSVSGVHCSQYWN